MITIEPYNREFQNEINKMLFEISNEFETSIFHNGQPIKDIKYDKYWVALKGQEIVGTAAIVLIENRYAILKNMFVKKEFRGKRFGVSHTLLLKALHWCKSEKITNIYLGTMEQFIAAQKFYEKNDFHKIDRNQLPESFIHNPIDSVFYKKDLNFDIDIKKVFSIRNGNIHDLNSVKRLGQTTWKQFEKYLTLENWNKLSNNTSDENLYKDLLLNSTSFICENETGEIIGMSFLVASGNPTEIYNHEQCYIRFVTVSDEYKGLKIGQKLTEACIEFAKKNGEKKIALHTSEFMDKARYIYEKLGFIITKEIEPRYGKKYWLYEKSI
jgi:GNAT superfamily N-acetyltransferase